MVHGSRSIGHYPTHPSGAPPGRPASCQGRHRASTSFAWFAGQGGDPAELVSEFLAGNGLPVRNIGRTDEQVCPTGAGSICGAALYVSADAGSVMSGGVLGAPTPVPGIPDVYAVVYTHTDEPPGPPAAPGFALGEWTPSWTPGEHAAAVSSVREAIGRGDVYQVNVVGHTSAPYAGSPLAALHRVAALPGARYGGLLAGTGWALATASPETLVEVRAGRVITRPIKGTRPATAEGRRELLASAKERAEHVMIVDLSRNDLSRLPGVGPVTVEDLFAVRRWSGLWQAESVVSAPVTGELSLAALLRALVPGGSVTGAPKLAALSEIARLEPVGRGVSMAAAGWIGPGHVDLGLTIRTVAADGARIHAWAGGGIVWDSDPEAEVAEAAAKLAPIKAALAGRAPA